MGRTLRAVVGAAFAVALHAAHATDPVELELPTLDGGSFFSLLQAGDRPVVLNFWDDECPPCVREMPLFDRTAKARRDVLFVGVALTERRRALDFLEAHAVDYLQLAAPPEPRGVLRRFSNRTGALPHTVVLRADHTLCAVRTGEVDAAWLKAALDRCAPR